MNLQLTLTGKRFSITPVPAHIHAACTQQPCSSRASHRLLSGPQASVQLLCDAHVLAWAGSRRLTITTSNGNESSAA